MQITNRQPIDYFKVFKVFDLKKLDKQGEVKLTQDKILGRKVLSVQGNVSTQNYIIFDSAQIIKAQPNLSFAQRYLYIMGYMQVSKNFCFQLILYLNAKIHKVLYSTVYKAPKMTPQGILQMPLDMKSAKWTIIVIDLYELCEKYSELDQIRLSFKLATVQIRANSKVKNIYLSDNLYDPHSMPKDIQLTLKPGEDFYMKYNYVVLSQKIDKATTESKSLLNQTKNKLQSNKSKNMIEGNPEQAKQKISVSKDKSRSIQKQNQSNNTEKIQQFKINQSKTIKVPPKQGFKKSTKTSKQGSKILPHQSFDIQNSHDEVPIANRLPKPKVTIEAKLCALQGRTISSNSITTLQAFITSPSIFAVHKPIKCLSLHKNILYKLAVGYNDGSICIWDIIRQKSLSYIKTQLTQLKQIQFIGQGQQQKIFIVGNDKMKRETILIISISSSQILFKQISNYSINGFLVCEQTGQTSHTTHNKQTLILSYGFQNIRIWKLNPINHIITGIGLYLGKMNRKVTYNSACRITQDIILVCDSNGYITCISLCQQKMQQMKKISQNGLDLILHIPQLNSILISQTSGTLKLLNYQLQLQQQFQLGNRVKQLSYIYNKQNGQIILNIDHYNNSLAIFNITKQQYQYRSRQHNQDIIGLRYSSRLNKIVSMSRDGTIRVWAIISSSYNTNNNINMNNNSNNKLQYQIKQQYQFLLSNGQTMTTLTLDNSVHAYIGFKGGIVRKIDIQKYQIISQEIFIFKNKQLMHNGQYIDSQIYITSIEVSRNNKNILICVKQVDNKYGNIIGMYVILCDSNLQILYKYNAPSQLQYTHTHTHNNPTTNKTMQVLSSFSQTHKKLYICWTYGSGPINRIQIYSLSHDMGQVCVQFYLSCVPRQIRYINECIQVDGYDGGNNVYEVYDDQSGQLKKVINSSIGNMGGNSNGISHGNYKISYPISVSNNNKQQLQIHTLNLNIKQVIDMPQNVSNITICPYTQGQKGTGMIICSGNNSHALYAISYHIRNIQELYNYNNRVEEEKQQRQEEMEVYQQFKEYNNKSNKVSVGNIVRRNRQIGALKQLGEELEEQLQCVQSKMILFNGNGSNGSDGSQMQMHKKTLSKITNMNINTNKQKSNKCIPSSPANNISQLSSNRTNMLSSYTNTNTNNIPSEIVEQNSFQYAHQQPYTNTYNKNIKNLSMKPTSLKGIYQKQQQMYQQCKQYIHPQLYPYAQTQHGQNIDIGYQHNNQIYNANKYSQSTQSCQTGVQLIYGWHNKYSYTNTNTSTCIQQQQQYPQRYTSSLSCRHRPIHLIWQPNNQSAIFLSQRNLILHYFKQPIQQKIIRLPTYPSLIMGLGLGSANKYIAVAMGNQIRLYSSQLSYLRTFSALGQNVCSMDISNCQGYVIVLSESTKNGKIYIQVIDIITSSTLCSTYIGIQQLSPSSLTHTHTSTSSISLTPLTIITNPNQQCLQFLIYSPTHVYFYRMTSILTLQTQPLQNLQHILNNTDIGQIMCVRYIKLQQQQIILLGMQDGSIIVVDGRAGCIVMVCRNVCKYGIIDILYHIDSNIGNSKLVIITKSSTILSYTLTQPKLSSLIQCITTATYKPTQLTTDSQITIHSQLHLLSSNNQLGMLVMSKFGVLWLIDISDGDTIKILTVHNNNTAGSSSSGGNVCKALLYQQPTTTTNTSTNTYNNTMIISGSIDGTIKQTSLYNLQQIYQIYKPRRVVHDILIANQMLIVGFGMEVYFYTMAMTNNYSDFSKEKDKNKEWKFIGSINLLDMYNNNNSSSSINNTSVTTSNISSNTNTNKLSKIHKYPQSTKLISIKSIPYSDNYIILTTQKLFIIYHQKILSLQTGKLKLQIKQICSDLNKAEGLDIYGYNHVMVREKEKINVWVRKEKRGENIVEQLSRLEECVYYMMDVYQVGATDCGFMGGNMDMSTMGMMDRNNNKIVNNNNNNKQYILCLANKPIIQWRDYQQHCIVRQLEIGVSCPRILRISHDGNYIIGDQEGIVWLIKQNGLTLNKVKVFDSAIGGIELFKDERNGGCKVMVYGASVAVVNL